MKIVTRGYGTFSVLTFLPTRGYGTAAALFEPDDGATAATLTDLAALNSATLIDNDDTPSAATLTDV